MKQKLKINKELYKKSFEPESSISMKSVLYVSQSDLNKVSSAIKKSGKLNPSKYESYNMVEIIKIIWEASPTIECALYFTLFFNTTWVEQKLFNHQ